jgi:hypothetical protein
MGYTASAWGKRTDIVIVNGQALAKRVHAAVLDAAAEVGITAIIVQGSYNPGGVAASGGTHAKGGSVDIKVTNIPRDQQVPFVIALRKRGLCAWLRDPDHGWPAKAGGPHIHAIDRYEPDLSADARWQVQEYDAHRLGLSAGGRDPIPHPTQHKFTEADMALTPSDANTVWNSRTTDPVTKEDVSMRTIVNRTRLSAAKAQADLDALEAKLQSGGAGAALILSEADKQDIASRVADLLAIRLKG